MLCSTCMLKRIKAHQRKLAKERSLYAFLVDVMIESGLQVANVWRSRFAPVLIILHTRAGISLMAG